MNDIQCLFPIHMIQWVIIPDLDFVEDRDLLERKENPICGILKLLSV